MRYHNRVDRKNILVSFVFQFYDKNCESKLDIFNIDECYKVKPALYTRVGYRYKRERCYEILLELIHGPSVSVSGTVNPQNTYS